MLCDPANVINQVQGLCLASVRPRQCHVVGQQNKDMPGVLVLRYHDKEIWLTITDLQLAQLTKMGVSKQNVA